jgi:aminoglycoside phosphotransferase (APT) family kinase protein
MALPGRPEPANEPRPAPAALDEAGEVREEDRLDAERLAAFLAGTFPGTAGPLRVHQFRRGHSNLTYLVAWGEREMVLRRAPHGANVKTAHDMRREFTILSALRPVYPKAPRPLAFCDDEGIAGARFYLMERVRGVVLRREGAEGLELRPELMGRLSRAFADGLAELHAVDVSKGSLAALGKPEGYAARQVKGWTERYRKARTDDWPEVEAAAAWIARNVPPDAGRAALVHNDYKYDNLVLDPGDPARVRAVLDWEMATLGDPVLDLGSTLAYWVDPDDPPEMRSLAFGPTALPGNLGRARLAGRYAERSGRDPGPLLFPYVFGLFKLAVIVQQIHRRWRDGFTTDPRFAEMGDMVRLLGAQASRALDRGRIDALG